MKVVILAGGLGTRLSEYTKTIPKPMVPINGKPMIVHIMNHYYKYGFKDFYIALGYKSEVIKEYFYSIWLDVNEDILFQRLKKNKNKRPLLNSLNDNGLRRKIKEIMYERKDCYIKANKRIELNEQSIKDIFSNGNSKKFRNQFKK